jgi:glycine/D-amino acid oxidase-like deaminating enzyme
MTVDYIIIGQGICGTFLSWNLIRAGKKVLVIDESKAFTASKTASGVINPVTGRRIVRTWRIEELLPFAIDAYTTFGNELNVELIQQTSILDFHPSLQMKEAFDKRLDEGEDFLQHANSEDWKNYFNYHYSVGAIKPCLLLDINTMLNKWRQKLKDENLLLEDSFNWQDCKVHEDYVTYKNIMAAKVFCCDGVAGFDNPYFKNLPYAKIKGEAIIASIPGLPSNYIYKQGINIVRWSGDLFWIGSSYEWSYDNVEPTVSFRKKMEEQLKYWLKLPYVVIDHLASERPATIERRPFVGLHPVFPSIGILNGMGTKGCSLAPFFAKQLTEHVIDNKPLYGEADVRRFKKILTV